MVTAMVKGSCGCSCRGGSTVSAGQGCWQGAHTRHPKVVPGGKRSAVALCSFLMPRHGPGLVIRQVVLHCPQDVRVIQPQLHLQGQGGGNG